MDVDGDDRDIRPREVADYGIEVDFETLEDEDREVRSSQIVVFVYIDRAPRMVHRKLELSWMLLSRN